MYGSTALVFFLIIGLVIFLIIWIIVAIAGKESVEALKCLVKKRKLDRKYNMLIFFLGALIGFVVIYLPYIINPVALFSQFILVQTLSAQKPSPQVMGGVLYDVVPAWAYFYWTYIFLGIMFVVGLSISMVYTLFRILKKEKLSPEMKLLLIYPLFTFIVLSLLARKNSNYFVILFPFFCIYMIMQITSIIERAARSDFSSFVKKNCKALSVFAIVILMLLPGPVWMTLDNPNRGTDSHYDKAGKLVTDYVNSNSNDSIYIIAYDRYALAYYLSDEILDRTRLITLNAGNYSVDALGFSYVYYPPNVLFNMTMDGTIDLIVDEQRFDDDSENEIRLWSREHAVRVDIENELVVYYL
jgi:hypothetical protein